MHWRPLRHDSPLKPLETRQRFARRSKPWVSTPITWIPGPAGRPSRSSSNIIELHYDLRQVPERERWTLDYTRLEDWTAVIEGDDAFQTLVNQQPRFTSVFYDAGPG